MVLAWSKFLGVSYDFELNQSVRGSVRSLLMVSLNLDKKTFLGPNVPPMTILPLSLTKISSKTMLMCWNTWHILKARKKVH